MSLVLVHRADRGKGIAKVAFQFAKTAYFRELKDDKRGAKGDELQ
jgi:hypothetical protein